MKKWLEKRAALLKRMRAIHETAETESRALTEAEQTEWDAAETEIRGLDARIAGARALEELERNAPAEPNVESGVRNAESGERSSRVTPAGAGDADGGDDGHSVRAMTVVPATVPRWGRPRNFQGSLAEAEVKAYRFGMFCAAVRGAKWALKFCQEHGIQLRAMEEGNNVAGGYLVPPEFDNDIIDLRDRYGVFRRRARVVPMVGDVKSRRRIKGGLTAYFVGEGAAGTESAPTFDMVMLIAKKIMCLTTVTSELSEDAVMSVGDLLAGELALAFATKEDQCGFTGDLTSTYGNIYGVKNKLTSVGTAGLKTANSGTNAAWTEITLAELNAVIALLPEYAETPNVAWYCSKAFYSGVMEALLYAAGGNTIGNLADGPSGRKFLGYPVELTPTMPKAAGTAEVVCMLGDLRLAADFGDRRQMSIAFSNDATVGSVSVFETDEVAMRGTQRFDINVHDVGDSTNAGPVVGLLTAA